MTQYTQDTNAGGDMPGTTARTMELRPFSISRARSHPRRAPRKGSGHHPFHSASAAAGAGAHRTGRCVVRAERRDGARPLHAHRGHCLRPGRTRLRPRVGHRCGPGGPLDAKPRASPAAAPPRWCVLARLRRSLRRADHGDGVAVSPGGVPKADPIAIARQHAASATRPRWS